MVGGGVAAGARSVAALGGVTVVMNQTAAVNWVKAHAPDGALVDAANGEPNAVYVRLAQQLERAPTDKKL